MCSAITQTVPKEAITKVRVAPLLWKLPDRRKRSAASHRVNLMPAILFRQIPPRRGPEGSGASSSKGTLKGQFVSQG